MIEDEMEAGGTEPGEVPDVATDATLRKVIATLSVLPPVGEGDVQRIVARAAAGATASATAAGGTADVVPLRPARRRWFNAMPLAAAAGLVLAAGIGGFVLRDMTAGTASPDARAIAAASEELPAPSSGISPVAGNSRLEAPISTQFVLDAPDAARVSVVGAFNSWDAAATPLERDPTTGLWTVTLPLAPGRHVYAFMVNDTALTLDPRAPSTRDPDLGTTGSVILVGTP